MLEIKFKGNPARKKERKKEKEREKERKQERKTERKNERSKERKPAVPSLNPNYDSRCMVVVKKKVK